MEERGKKRENVCVGWGWREEEEGEKGEKEGICSSRPREWEWGSAFKGRSEVGNNLNARLGSCHYRLCDQSKGAVNHVPLVNPAPLAPASLQCWPMTGLIAELICSIS